MEARMRNPAVVLAETMQAINGHYKAVRTGGLPKQTLELVHLRVSRQVGHSTQSRTAERSQSKIVVTARPSSETRCTRFGCSA